MIRLIVGLGNPGARYEQTRHNAGFVFLQAAAARLDVVLKPGSRFHGAFGTTRWQADKVWLLRPDTFMNRSGLAVAALARYHRIAAGEILVVHDELDLPPGVARLKTGGGDGGHNGVASVIESLGARDFLRLRIGIGRPEAVGAMTGYVLTKAPPAEFEGTRRAIERALAVLPDLLDADLARAMQRLHSAAPETAG